MCLQSMALWGLGEYPFVSIVLSRLLCPACLAYFPNLIDWFLPWDLPNSVQKPDSRNNMSRSMATRAAGVCADERFSNFLSVLHRQEPSIITLFSGLAQTTSKLNFTPNRIKTYITLLLEQPIREQRLNWYLENLVLYCEDFDLWKSTWKVWST